MRKIMEIQPFCTVQSFKTCPKIFFQPEANTTYFKFDSFLSKNIDIKESFFYIDIFSMFICKTVTRNMVL